MITFTLGLYYYNCFTEHGEFFPICETTNYNKAVRAYKKFIKVKRLLKPYSGRSYTFFEIHIYDGIKQTTVKRESGNDTNNA